MPTPEEGFVKAIPALKGLGLPSGVQRTPLNAIYFESPVRAKFGEEELNMAAKR